MPAISKSNHNQPDQLKVLNRLGAYKASRVGNGWKVSLPQEIVKIWKLEDMIKPASSKSKKQKLEKDKMPDLYVYADFIHEEICLIISSRPLPGDIQHLMMDDD